MAGCRAARTVQDMLDQRLRVGVGVEPFVLRSALGACLQRDPRLDVEVLPPSCDNDTVGSIMLPKPRRVPDAMLTAVEDCPPRVEVFFGGTYRSLPYEGMEGFAETLFNAIVAVGPGECSDVAGTEGDAR